jgi:epoxyqueuosine reductase QueG
MIKDDIVQKSIHFVETSIQNRVDRESAINDSVKGMKIFEVPLFAFGSADDELFKLLKNRDVIGEHHLLPLEWLPGAQSVISFFLPFSEAVIAGNRRDMGWPSPEWLHGRIEGQKFINRLALYIKDILDESGYEGIIPMTDGRFMSENGSAAKGKTDFTSNWSERHAAYICGLGTFSLSKGLITVKGVAGRFGSVITDLYIPPDERPYSGVTEHCNICGACAVNCPVDAISIENGKNHRICADFLDITAEKFSPRYGCGKCQVKVPCEMGIPLKKIPVKPVIEMMKLR